MQAETIKKMLEKKIPADVPTQSTEAIETKPKKPTERSKKPLMYVPTQPSEAIESKLAKETQTKRSNKPLIDQHNHEKPSSIITNRRSRLYTFPHEPKPP
jgi:rubrerythrin